MHNEEGNLPSGTKNGPEQSIDTESAENKAWKDRFKDVFRRGYTRTKMYSNKVRNKVHVLCGANPEIEDTNQKQQ